MTDTQILDFLNELTVDEIRFDSGEFVDVRGGDVRAAIIGIVNRERCIKCKCLVGKGHVDDPDDSGFCRTCAEEEKDAK